MTAARKVIEWRHQDPSALVRALEDLPEGRYVLVPEGEVAAEAEEAEAIQAGIEEAERGELVDWSQVREQIDGITALAVTRRPR